MIVLRKHTHCLLNHPHTHTRTHTHTHTQTHLLTGQLPLPPPSPPPPSPPIVNAAHFHKCPHTQPHTPSPPLPLMLTHLHRISAQQPTSLCLIVICFQPTPQQPARLRLFILPNPTTPQQPARAFLPICPCLLTLSFLYTPPQLHNTYLRAETPPQSLHTPTLLHCPLSRPPCHHHLRILQHTPPRP